ncbi:helix-turn-helix domain-containing protein [Fodinibius salsisoli]|uniref:AraC family transcriptional regulator n=1 Tax=Fodinibius salsisoli TaxID=2820877 RepID=A0ABT3PHV4_9BACT|nr:helix-turn-helix domain-containing protein [Fodinibius salsisoli]MCW9705495.1 AraC family transcriptional regulator [Fodinibius salsisoli]
MAVTYTTIPPPDHLSTYVRFFWILESNGPYVHRQLADISPELIFHYKGKFDKIGPEGARTPSFRSGIHGQSNTISRFTIDREFGIFGVYLYPYAIPPLLQMESTEIIGRMPDLSTLWSKEGSLLEEQMCTAADNQQRLQIITDFLSQKLLNRENNHPAIFNSVQYILKTKGILTVETLASKCGLSQRQFGRLFKQYTGFTPKLFSRITRFHAATKRYENGYNQSLTEVALDCGYYDQSHFIQDFKTFAGCLPSVFFSGEAEGTEWRDA